MSRKEELIQILCERYHEDEKELQEYNEKELAELLHELEDHSDMYPNGDEYDEWKLNIGTQEKQNDINKEKKWVNLKDLHNICASIVEEKREDWKLKGSQHQRDVLKGQLIKLIVG